MNPKIKRILSSPGSNFLLLGGAWGAAAIGCLCPACLAGPAVLLARGVVEKVPTLKRLI